MTSPTNTKNSNTEIPPLVETKNLAVGYSEGKTIIEDVNLSVFAGSITSIIGQNGCGKSTLLKTLARQLKPHSGAVLISGKASGSYLPKTFPNNVPIFLNFCPMV